MIGCPMRRKIGRIVLASMPLIILALAWSSVHLLHTDDVVWVLLGFALFACSLGLALGLAIAIHEELK